MNEPSSRAAEQRPPLFIERGGEVAAGRAAGNGGSTSELVPQARSSPPDAMRQAASDFETRDSTTRRLDSNNLYSINLQRIVCADLVSLAIRNGSGGPAIVSVATAVFIFLHLEGRARRRRPLLVPAESPPPRTRIIRILPRSWRLVATLQLRCR